MTRGRFITFEGGEGAGKSTQSLRLVQALQSAGIDVVRTREPGGASGAEAIRDLLVQGAIDRWAPMSEALLHYAARHEHLLHTVRPALESGRWVVCDRFADSTMAYQGYGHGLGRAAITSLHRLTLGDFVPDLTLIFDLPVDLGLQRAAARRGGEDRYERMDRDFHRRLREGFLEIARAEPGRCVLIDAGGDIGKTTASIFAAVRERLGVAVG